MKTAKIRVKRFFNQISKTIHRPDMKLLPGHLSFFLVLAIIPTMTLVSFLTTRLNLSLDFIYKFIEKAFSSNMANLILSTADGNNEGVKLMIVVFFSYFIASNGMDAVIVTSNRVYGIENKNFIKRKPKSILMSLIFIILIIFMIIVPIFGERIVSLISKVNLNSNVTNNIRLIFNFLKNPFMIVLLFFFIKIIYMIAPDRKLSSKYTNYGALFTTISWTLITIMYSYYINNIADYSALYGGLTSICILMIWFYLLSYIFVIGISLNYEKEREDLSNNI
ncbi:MAG: YihY/virulence factor BrkB family protein [Mollicutes bacterium]|nr:YihY/virulence factor BrkB family protein [Mollicutes bacterium]